MKKREKGVCERSLRLIMDIGFRYAQIRLRRTSFPPMLLGEIAEERCINKCQSRERPSGLFVRLTGRFKTLSDVLQFQGGEGMKQMKIIVEKHPEGYVAYPLGLKGVVVGEGDTYEEALADVKSAIRFHIKTFGQEALEIEEVMETFVAEVALE